MNRENMKQLTVIATVLALSLTIWLGSGAAVQADDDATEPDTTTRFFERDAAERFARADENRERDREEIERRKHDDPEHHEREHREREHREHGGHEEHEEMVRHERALRMHLAEMEHTFATFEVVNRVTELASSEHGAAIFAVMNIEENFHEPEQAIRFLEETLPAVEARPVKRAIHMKLAQLLRAVENPDRVRDQLRRLITDEVGG